MTVARDDPFRRMVRVRTRRRNGKRVFVSWRTGRSSMSLDPEDLRALGIDEPATEKPSPIALAVLWAASAVLAILLVSLLLAVLSVLIGGHPWWTR